MREAIGVGRAEPDLFEQPRDAPVGVGARRERVNVDPLANDVAHAHARIERRLGILEDDLRLAPELQEGVAGECQHIRTLKSDAA